jgi:wyosine [tRNA(Phe)-imidazoG37] synthetase (radical SAM superfamily)
MATFLFDTIVFGPVWSRRLGESLGINLLPAGRKVCNFNCVYCECGITPIEDQQFKYPTFEEIRDLLGRRLQDMKENGGYLDSITFAGNGEPTLHPDFPRIIDEAIEIRNRYFPKVQIAVLSNATLIYNDMIFAALLKADRNILKLDSAIEDTLRHINCPRGIYNLPVILETLKKFQGKLIIQTLFLRGFCNGKFIDNTTEKEVTEWIDAIEKISPESVMIYSIARDTAIQNLEQVNEPELIAIARQLEDKGIRTQVTP